MLATVLAQAMLARVVVRLTLAALAALLPRHAARIFARVNLADTLNARQPFLATAILVAHLANITPGDQETHAGGFYVAYALQSRGAGFVRITADLQVKAARDEYKPIVYSA